MRPLISVFVCLGLQHLPAGVRSTGDHLLGHAVHDPPAWRHHPDRNSSRGWRLHEAGAPVPQGGRRGGVLGGEYREPSQHCGLNQPVLTP